MASTRLGLLVLFHVLLGAAMYVTQSIPDAYMVRPHYHPLSAVTPNTHRMKSFTSLKPVSTVQDNGKHGTQRSPPFPGSTC